MIDLSIFKNLDRLPLVLGFIYPELMKS